MDNLEVVQPTRDFKDLSDSEKVQAILGAVEEPVSKDFALELGGVDYESLNPEDKTKVDRVFTDESVEKTGVDGEQRYMLNSSGRSNLESEVNIATVHGAIACSFERTWS